jgi:phospholipid-binding lipoprotein MlaA
MKKICITALLFLLAGCVNKTPQDGDIFEAQDPIKPFNQAIFEFNLAADQAVIKPVAETYHQMPEVARGAVGNFLSNLSEPANAVNGVLQFDPQIVFTAFWRFTLNTTFGLAGLRDFASENGLKSKDTDFGKTLGRYGVEEGAYIVLPLAGPSTVRGTAGKAVDWVLDPVGFVLNLPESIAQTCVSAIATRDSEAAIINQFYYDSLEPYSATRAGYLQHQAFQ